MKHTLYTERDHMPAGMYLGLMHGRNSPTESMEDWGFQGPVIGPLDGFHVTYQASFRVGFCDEATAEKFFPERDDDWVELKFVNGLLEYEGKFYGDYTGFYHPGPKVAEVVAPGAQMCFYLPGCTYIDDVAIFKGGKWVSSIASSTLEEIAQIRPGLKMVRVDDAMAQIGIVEAELYIRQPVVITEERFYDMLNVLPPVNWRRDSNGESFKMSEHDCGEYTAYFARIGDVYFEGCNKASFKHKQILAECWEALGGLLR